MGVVVLALAACRQEKIIAYSAPKEKPAAVSAETAPAEKTLWKTPAGWQQLPSTEIRLGNFMVKDAAGKKAEIVVTSFPGNVGTELDNVNRWRNQLGLDPVSPELIKAESVEIGGASGKLYDFTGPSADKTAQRMTVASLARNGATWFFKMLGDESVVETQRNAFHEFLKSVTFADARPAGAIPAAPVSTNVKKVPEPAGDKPTWNTPADWNPVTPSAMLLAKFIVAAPEGGKAEVTVSAFPGDVGGPLANVNRWRGQLNLPAVEQDAMEKLVSSVDVIGGKAMLVDLSGTDAKTGQKVRLIAAMVPKNGRTWFYKLIGDETVVGKQKDAFVKFVQTVRYPDA